MELFALFYWVKAQHISWKKPNREANKRENSFGNSKANMKRKSSKEIQM